MALFVRNLSDPLVSESREFAKTVFDSFSCKHNPEVDHYLKAITID